MVIVLIHIVENQRGISLLAAGNKVHKFSVFRLRPIVGNLGSRNVLFTFFNIPHNFGVKYMHIFAYSMWIFYRHETYFLV